MPLIGRGGRPSQEPHAAALARVRPVGRVRLVNGEPAGWSDRKKFWMGLFEKALVLLVTGAVTFFIVDLYSAALDERDARQTQLWNQIERLEEASLTYQIDFYDAYYTPCGDAGRKIVRRLLDEDYARLKLELDRTRRARGLLFDRAAAQQVVQLADQYRELFHQVYREHLRPRLRCDCPQGSGRLAPRACPPREGFAKVFKAMGSARGHLVHVMYEQYRLRAARSMLELVWTR